VSVFFLRRNSPPDGAGSNGGLTFINICIAARRYGMYMVLRPEIWSVCAMIKPVPGLIGEPSNL